jgi:DNA-binding transcriptional regulator YdaS (Cro superfamily)
MKTSDAIQHFRTQSAIARALGISDAAVSKWGDVVPFESATALEIVTHGALVVDRSLYHSLARAIDAASRSAPEAA